MNHLCVFTLSVILPSKALNEELTYIGQNGKIPDLAHACYTHMYATRWTSFIIV